MLKQDMMGRLAKAYNLFGKVIQGQDVVNRIQRGDTMITVRITESDPV
ncbi:MAG: peptidylprolyl isomerase [Dehalococcoidia bacterium]|nr:peptidylprolyl isomerase [Dehalococcoidia bacterium]